MSSERRAATKPCPSCGTGRIHTGEQAKYNARSQIDNTQICPGCAVKETVNRFIKNRK